MPERGFVGPPVPCHALSPCSLDATVGVLLLRCILSTSNAPTPRRTPGVGILMPNTWWPEAIPPRQQPGSPVTSGLQCRASQASASSLWPSTFTLPD